MNLITASDVSKSYFFAGRELVILAGANLQVAPGETIAVVGPSGVGKSTLLHLLGALDRPTMGKISICDVSLGELNEEQLAKLRSEKIGFVFQFHHLLPDFSALENVFLAGLIRGLDPVSCRRRAAELLTRVGLGERLDHKPGELSGGEQQRVALARALQNEPPIVLADEPTGNLDRGTARELQDLVFELARERGISFLIVTHDQQFAQRCDRILQLKDGKIAELNSELLH